jgi:hypothetical protein
MFRSIFVSSMYYEFQSLYVKIFFAANSYSDDVIVDVITICENSKFLFTPFCRSAGRYKKNSLLKIK